MKLSKSRPAGKTLGQYTGGMDEDRTREGLKILSMLDYIPSAGALSDDDYRFVADMMEKRKEFGSGLLVTGRQLFWLRDIKDKLIEKVVI